MKYLLDTHIWLWLQMAPERVPELLRQDLENSDTQILLSAVTSWECAIKASLGKLTLPAGLETMVRESTSVDGMVPLPVSHEHCFELEQLPALHSDPFDRLLIAQARRERCVLVSTDVSLRAYDVQLRWE